MKQLFVQTLSSVPGIVNIQANQDNLNKTQNTNNVNYVDLIEVFHTPQGWDFIAAVSILNGVPAKCVLEELQSQMQHELKKHNQKVNNITIFIRGVENV
ncbi:MULTISPECIES: hypothetical protein [unclassified Mycoplasma]|uniref:hypothetical protein n=1 Tax=unclassified Mycoplasma TaxID=2683645 RepID=UPI00211D115A|nr:MULTISPECIES: hypothetical protein [unclassified Mycoplasma]UUM19780.1 hypothetical protein NPA11_03360 [Mycoplasma sp. 1578d]UUM24763.1 hypothetical protein NPA12_03650 [Mycoplasma sp. 3686d]